MNISCEYATPSGSVPVDVAIKDDCIAISGGGVQLVIDYADLLDFRLLNYHLILETSHGQEQLCKMGRETENVFEKLWLAYMKRSRTSLFQDVAPSSEFEGDFEYSEEGGRAAGKGKISLYEDCLCLLPHDSGARRIPFVFMDEPVREGFWLNMRLDTGEAYRIGRFGADTDPLFNGIASRRGAALQKWTAAHAALPAALRDADGETAARFAALKATGADVRLGLFGLQDEGGEGEERPYWMVALAPGRAALEFVIGESAATYLYAFGTSVAEFEASLRHATEAVKSNREVIYLEDAALAQNSLYRMAVDRSRHVRFLRSCLAGRLIHNATWEKRLGEFFA